MINVGLYNRIKKSHEEGFGGTFKEVEKYLPQGNGFRIAKLCMEVSSTQPVAHMIYSEWGSIEGFANFTGSKAFRNATGHAEEIIESQPQRAIFYEYNAGV